MPMVRSAGLLRSRHGLVGQGGLAARGRRGRRRVRRRRAPALRRAVHLAGHGGPAFGDRGQHRHHGGLLRPARRRVRPARQDDDGPRPLRGPARRRRLGHHGGHAAPGAGGAPLRCAPGAAGQRGARPPGAALDGRPSRPRSCAMWTPWPGCEALRSAGAGGRVLVEIGYADGRAGCRSVADAVAVAVGRRRGRRRHRHGRGGVRGSAARRRRGARVPRRPSPRPPSAVAPLLPAAPDRQRRRQRLVRRGGRRARPARRRARLAAGPAQRRRGDPRRRHLPGVDARSTASTRAR